VAVLTLFTANTHWVEVVIPSPPWNPARRWVTLEVQAWALFCTPFLLGVAVVMVGARRRARTRRLRRQDATEEGRWPPNDRDLA
jgi:hypothetical protein